MTSAPGQSEIANADDLTRLRSRYLDLLELSLTNGIYGESRLETGMRALVQRLRHPYLTRHGAQRWPARAHTMIGPVRLRHLRGLMERTIAEGIPGDYIETGVWRGGACILMRGVLAAYGVRSRKVICADSFRGVQAALGEILAWRHLMRAITTAMCLDPEPAPGGTVVPKAEYASTIKMFASECWPAVRRIFEKQLAGSLLVAPSSYKDLKNAELRPLIEKYYRGSSSTAEERVKLFKLIWDAIGTEFGARHELYEINYSGNNEQIRLDVLSGARRSGINQGDPPSPLEEKSCRRKADAS